MIGTVGDSGKQKRRASRTVIQMLLDGTIAQQVRTEALKKRRKIKWRVCILYSPFPKSSCEQYGGEHEKKPRNFNELQEPY